MRLLHFFIIALLLFGQADGLKWWQVNLSQPQAVSYAKHYKVLESLKLEKFLVLANP